MSYKPTNAIHNGRVRGKEQEFLHQLYFDGGGFEISAKTVFVLDMFVCVHASECNLPCSMFQLAIRVWVLIQLWLFVRRKPMKMTCYKRVWSQSFCQVWSSPINSVTWAEIIWDRLLIINRWIGGNISQKCHIAYIAGEQIKRCGQWRLRPISINEFQAIFLVKW